MSGVGHNSGDTAQTVAAGQLRAFFERWQRLEEEKQTISDDLREMFAEAKSSGFDTKAMRAVFRAKLVDQVERQEAEAMFDLYWTALDAAVTPQEKPLARVPREGKAATQGHNAAETPVETAAVEVPAHDPETGEILEDDQPEAAGEPEAEASDEDEETPPAPPVVEGKGPDVRSPASEPLAGAAKPPAAPAPSARRSEPYEIRDIPAFLDRRGKPQPKWEGDE